MAEILFVTHHITDVMKNILVFFTTLLFSKTNAFQCFCEYHGQFLLHK